MNNPRWWPRLLALIDARIRAVNAGGPLIVEGLAYAAPQATALDLPVGQAFAAGLRMVPTLDAGQGYTQAVGVQPQYARRYATLPQASESWTLAEVRPGLPVTSSGRAQASADPVAHVGAVWRAQLPGAPVRVQAVHAVFTPNRTSARRSDLQVVPFAAGAARYRVRVLLGGVPLHDSELTVGTSGTASSPATTATVAGNLTSLGGLAECVSYRLPLNAPVEPGVGVEVELTALALSPLVDLGQGSGGAVEYADPNGYPAGHLLSSGDPDPAGLSPFTLNGGPLLLPDQRAAPVPGGQVKAYPAWALAESTPAELDGGTLADAGTQAQLRGLAGVVSTYPAGLPFSAERRTLIVEFRAQVPAGELAAPHVRAAWVGVASGTDDVVDALDWHAVNGALGITSSRTGALYLGTLNGGTNEGTQQVPLTWGQWYRLELLWVAGGNVTGKVYDAESGLLLGNVPQGAALNARPAASPARFLLGLPPRRGGPQLFAPLALDVRRWAEWSSV